MASIILGAIITDIQGSIAGTTFRRTPRGTIMYNKQKRQYLSGNTKNSKKIQIAQVFQNWNRLDGDTKKEWADQAALFPFKDKFGNNKYLTNRQLYTKLNTQLIPIAEAVPGPNGLSSILDYPVISSINVNLSEFSLFVNLTETIGDDYYVCISIYPIRQGAAANPNKHRALTEFNAGGGEQFNVYASFIAQYPNSAPGQIFGCNVYTLNLSGFKSPVTFGTFVWQ